VALSRYNNYIRNVAQTPAQSWLSQQQAFINDQWKDTTQERLVEEQNGIGCNEYSLIHVWVSEKIEQGTGYKSSEDFAVFTFKDVNYYPQRGLYYKWDNNYWITTNTSAATNVEKEIVVRRCNNLLRWINPKNGAINSIPCVVEYDAQSPSPQVGKKTITPNNHYVIIIQGNEAVQSLRVNQRFILNNRPFKYSGCNNSLQEMTINGTPTLMYLDVYLDEIEPTDNMELSIANYSQYNFSINIRQSDFIQAPKGTGTLTADLLLNGEKFDGNIIWRSNSDAGKINSNGEYTLIGDIGDKAVFVAMLENNQYVTDEITITISDEQQDEENIVITPDINYLSQGDSVNISVYLYKNDSIVTSPMTYTASGADISSYSIIRVDDNTLSITNLKYSSVPLIIDFIIQDVKITKEITLGALF
jgi:hypothetical protein